LRTLKPVEGVSDSAAIHLSQAIQIKTVSFGDTLAIDTSEFIRFRSFLEQTYPLVHQKLNRQIFSQFSYVYTLVGKNPSLSPYVLMAHMDVVPVEAAAEKNWSVPPFSGTIKDSAVWGRGAIDDKASVISILEATEQLLKENFQPQQTIYLCFGHDEEISGKRGAAKISAWFKEQKITPALVLDEGGVIDTEHFKDIKQPIAVIGVGEKGYVNIDLVVEKAGGHSSMPEKETAIDILNTAVTKIRASQMPAKITNTVQQMFNRIGPASGFTNRMALSNRWLFEGMLVSQLEKTKETNAMVHTTLVPTIIKSGIKDNVIPSVAKATFNSRILPGQTSDDVVNFVKNAINDERVSIQKQTISLMEPSTATSPDDPAFKKVESIVSSMIPDVLPTPYLMIGATDSRYFRPFSKAVVNFAPMTNAKGFHGIDERASLKDVIPFINNK
jgi:carboxypeptidase PM20D1